MKTILPLASAALAGLLLAGCINVRTHSSFEPIYMKLDIDLRVKLQKELASVFEEIDAASATVQEAE